MTKNRVAHKLDTVKWALPSDAEEHYKFLLKETEKYRNIEIHEAHGFRGPWYLTHDKICLHIYSALEHCGTKILSLFPGLKIFL